MEENLQEEINSEKNLKYNTESHDYESHFTENRQKYFCNLFTNSYVLEKVPFDVEDLDPDLVIAIKVPLNKPTILLRDKVELNQFLRIFDKDLENVYKKLEEILIAQTEAELKRRQQELQKEKSADRSKMLDEQKLEGASIKGYRSFIPLKENFSNKAFVYEEPERIDKEEIGNQCNFEMSSELDLFKLNFNTFVYFLQQKCGFFVRAFMEPIWNEKESQKALTQRTIFLFLRQSTENLIILADRYSIKKEADYTHMDYFINDPTDSVGRPLRKHSFATQDPELSRFDKHLCRKLGLKDFNYGSVIDEVEYDDEYDQNEQKWIIHPIKQKFKNIQDQSRKYLLDLQNKKQIQLSPEEKNFIVQYNRGKNNKGVQKQFIKLKQRKVYFQHVKNVYRLYGFPPYETPFTSVQFMKPSKHKSFFQKFNSLLFYKPLVVSPYGDLSLFYKMDRIKLCYLALKQVFKPEGLKKLNYDIMALHDNFEKKGTFTHKHQNQRRNWNKDIVRGGIDGENLETNWSALSLGSSIKIIRNYFGEKIGNEILVKKAIFWYFCLVSPFFFIAFLIEEIVVKQSSNLGTTFFEVSFLVLTFGILIQRLEMRQKIFKENFIENKTQINLVENYRGAYTRHLITDEINFFQKKDGFLSVLVNVFNLVVITAIIIVEALIFLGIRKLIVATHYTLESSKVQNLSLVHIIFYSIYFLLNHRYGLRRVIFWLIDHLKTLKNPSTDEQATEIVFGMRLYYIVCFQLIGPVFFLVIEPFSKNSCYAASCNEQLIFFIYSRYVVLTLMTFINAGGMIKNKISKIFQRKVEVEEQQKQKKNKRKIEAKDFEESYKDKNDDKELGYLNKSNGQYFQKNLQFLLQRAHADRKKPSYDSRCLQETIQIMCYTMYAASFSLTPLLMLLNIGIEQVTLRVKLLSNTRREIPKSEKLYFYSYPLNIAFHIGLLINIWVMFQSYEYVEYRVPGFVDSVIKDPNYNTILLLKIIVTVAFVIIYEILFFAVKALTNIFSNSDVENRKNYKYTEYVSSKIKSFIQRNTEALKPHIPLKTLFRVFNQNLQTDIAKEIEHKKIVAEEEKIAASKQASKKGSVRGSLSERKSASKAGSRVGSRLSQGLNSIREDKNEDEIVESSHHLQEKPDNLEMKKEELKKE